MSEDRAQGIARRRVDARNRIRITARKSASSAGVYINRLLISGHVKTLLSTVILMFKDGLGTIYQVSQISFLKLHRKHHKFTDEFHRILSFYLCGVEVCYVMIAAGGLPIPIREKSAANHVASRIPFNDIVEPFLGSRGISGYNRA